MANLYDSILITGGGGMLAHAIVRSLERRGRTAVAPNRAALDITNANAVRAAFATHKPTLVINGHAVGTLARAAREHGAVLVHYSTDFVFDGAGTRPYRSDDPVGPISAYGRSKLLGERELQAHAPDRWLVLRTAWLYGRNGPCFPRTMVNAARAGKPLKVVADQTGSPTLTDDLAEVTFDLLDRGASGVWHATNAGNTTWYGFTEAILKEFDLRERTSLAPTTTADWFRIKPDSAPRPAYSVLDVEPIAGLLGRPMRPWREALRDYRQQVEAAPETL
jgi:dTDP-4-dehydrorhamnose reductase